jgi:hypothetical protein
VTAPSAYEVAASGKALPDSGDAEAHVQVAWLSEQRNVARVVKGRCGF